MEPLERNRLQRYIYRKVQQRLVKEAKKVIGDKVEEAARELGFSDQISKAIGDEIKRQNYRTQPRGIGKPLVIFASIVYAVVLTGEALRAQQWQVAAATQKARLLQLARQANKAVAHNTRVIPSTTGVSRPRGTTRSGAGYIVNMEEILGKGPRSPLKKLSPTQRWEQEAGLVGYGPGRGSFGEGGTYPGTS